MESLKSMIRNYFVKPVTLERFENILESVGKDPVSAKAVRATAVTTGIPFTADEEAEQQIAELTQTADDQRSRAPEVEQQAQDKANRLRQRAQRIEEEGRQRRESLENSAETLENRAMDLTETMALLEQ